MRFVSGDPALIGDDILRRYIRQHMFKVIIISCLVLLSLVFVRMYVAGRVAAGEEVRETLSAEWGPATVIGEPQLKLEGETLSYTLQGIRQDKVINTDVYQKKDFYLNAENSEGLIKINSVQAERGNQYAVHYTAEVNFKTVFSFADLEKNLPEKMRSVTEKQLIVCLPLRGNTGLSEIRFVTVNGKKIRFESDEHAKGIVADAGEILSSDGFPDTLEIECSYVLRGSNVMTLHPSAGQSIIRAQFQGIMPDFSGDFLPRSVSADSAEFVTGRLSSGSSITDLYQNIGKNTGSVMSFSAKSSDTTSALRFVNYAVLFGIICLAAQICLEIFLKCPLHILQHALLSAVTPLFALTVFTLSELISFNTAFLLTSLCAAAAVTLYLSSVFKVRKILFYLCAFAGCIISSLLCFALVSDESYALPVFTTVAVLILAVFMYATSAAQKDNKLTGEQ